jgi:two-component system OmpR family sensor kinase
MGRLFWKFLFSFWLTLLLAGISVGTLVWLKQAAENEEDFSKVRLIDRHAFPFVSVAADIAEHGGLPALTAFLQQLDNSPMPSVLAVNENDKDILSREVDAHALSQAREWVEMGKRRVVRLIPSQQGNLLLFAPMPPEQRVFSQQPRKRPPPHARHWPLILLFASGFIASLIFSALLAWYFTRPIRSLKQAFNAVAQGKLDTRVSPEMGHRQDELAELGQNFDYMASQISSLVNGQRRLLHDVSHELRSPLARMQAAIGIAQQQPDKVEPTLQRLEREAQRISDLVGELLLLSRMETGVNHRHDSKIDLTLLLDEIVEDARFEAASKQIEIIYQSAADIQIHGQQELLHRAIENVLRNAIKFSHPGSEVKVTIHKDNAQKQLTISVEDQGPGVAEAELENIFQPFFRGKTEQRRDSIGLGLTIAQRAVEAHRGHIEAHNRSEGGLQIILFLELV